MLCEELLAVARPNGCRCAAVEIGVLPATLRRNVIALPPTHCWAAHPSASAGLAPGEQEIDVGCDRWIGPGS
jgi:hypothetical protein